MESDIFILEPTVVPTEIRIFFLFYLKSLDRGYKYEF